MLVALALTLAMEDSIVVGNCYLQLHFVGYIGPWCPFVVVADLVLVEAVAIAGLVGQHCPGPYFGSVRSFLNV